MADGALAGVRVLELSRILSGPFAGMILADLGAEVIKVEDTRKGDDTRQWGPPFQGDDATYFLSINRNKRSISVDLKTDKGREAVQRLADRADVVLENFRPGTAARLGFGYEELSARNPGLVYASISGFGQTGPYAERAGYDLIAQAMSGIMSVTGEADGSPVRMGTSAADLGAGMYAVIGVLAALHARRFTGRGQHIDISLLDGQISWLTYVAGNHFATGETPRRYGSAHPSIVPYQALPTADGHLMVAIGNDGLWRRFATAVGRGDLAEDPRFATNADRVHHREELLGFLRAALSSRTSAEWAEVLTEAGVPVGPINTVPEALAHPQVRARDMVVEVDHPGAGRLRMVGSPLKLSAHPPAVRSAPPGLGEHTDEVLAELGLGPDEIAAMREEGAVR
ncbi:CaiB/BaiF CoA-transferase family protein [Actinoallomurus sp. NPDC052308]|uniref:CaiB/BaiF CoA transferase family protein n=1 Tax=Actinoallomurus sp. NPDC052308 TaxID=3155530 RepID=UPI00342EB753